MFVFSQAHDDAVTGLSLHATGKFLFCSLALDTTAGRRFGGGVLGSFWFPSFFTKISFLVYTYNSSTPHPFLREVVHPFRTWSGSAIRYPSSIVL